MNPGLTLIVGPPGTGKTDVAVQIIANLYHNQPTQRTLIITHSNQALNQIFDKIVQLDIDERHCVRLGHGEEQLETLKDFSKYGRVNYFLAKRIELLAEVNRLAARYARDTFGFSFSSLRSLNIVGDFGYTCETASYFYSFHLVPRWEAFLTAIEGAHYFFLSFPSLTRASGSDKTVASVAQLFPFSAFFANAPQPLFPAAASFEQAIAIAKGCFDGHLGGIFTRLEEMRGTTFCLFVLLLTLY